MKIYVSRHKMTECPSCRSHIRVATDVADTACPFCGTVLGEHASRSIGLKMKAIGRGSLVAGALLGLSVVAACDDDTEPTPQPLYGAPADVITDTGTDMGVDSANDPGPQPLYGLPLDIQVDIAPDAGPQPEYGIPADE